MPTRRLPRLCPTVICGVLVALACPALADEHGGVRFTPPAGWERVDNGEARVLVAPSQSEEEALVVIFTPAQPATGATPVEQLAEITARLNEGAAVTSKGDVVTRDRGARGALLTQTMQVTDGDVGPHARQFALVITGDKRAVVLVIYKPDAMLERHSAALGALLLSVELVGAAAPAAKPAAPPPAGKLPTGDTPDLFPGSPGWLPSGRGTKIPEAQIVDGKPQGIWWKLAPQNTRLTVRPVIYLPDGTRASNPRPGGADLFDLEGQRRQKGATGVGTFALEGDQLVETYDGFVTRGTYTSGSDAEGPFFGIGAARYRPLARPTREGLIGTWTTTGGKYVFKADGTFEMGHVTDTGDFTVASGGQGTYELEGHLIAIRPRDAPMWISQIGAWGRRNLILGTTLYQRQE